MLQRGPREIGRRSLRHIKCKYRLHTSLNASRRRWRLLPGARSNRIIVSKPSRRREISSHQQRG